MTVFEPAWFATSWKKTVETQAVASVVGAGPTEICAHAILTGPVFGPGSEEALYVRTTAGIVVISSRAHPGAAKRVQAAQVLFLGETIALVTGGSHLAGDAAAAIRAMAQQVLDLGVVKAAST